jgi:general L-amino acid transport system permease protein
MFSRKNFFILVSFGFLYLLFSNITDIISFNKFNFLFQSSGFEISDSMIDFSRDSSLWYAFAVGILNTLKISIFVFVTTTILGFILALGIVSKNLLSYISSGIVGFIRNLPVLIVISFFYILLIMVLPSSTAPISLIGDVYLSQQGLHFPWIVNNLIEYPTMGNFGLNGGLLLTIEFVALWIGLSLYNAVFIAQIIATGINSFPIELKLTIESLNFTKWQSLKLIIIPWVFKSIIPSLINQYVNVFKNSSLGAAIGYPELFNIGMIATGQFNLALEVMILVSVFYLSISVLISIIISKYFKSNQIITQL